MISPYANFELTYASVDLMCILESKINNKLGTKYGSILEFLPIGVQNNWSSWIFPTFQKACIYSSSTCNSSAFYITTNWWWFQGKKDCACSGRTQPTKWGRLYVNAICTILSNVIYLSKGQCIEHNVVNHNEWSKTTILSTMKL